MVKGSSAAARFSTDFDVVAEHNQPLNDGSERGIGFEMRAQPIECRLHAAPTPLSGPRTREGISSGRKP